MAKRLTPDDLRDLRGPFNALIVRSMRRHGIKEITKWADHFSIGRSTLYDLLKGRETHAGNWVKPSLETLIKLAVAFDKPLHELVYMVEPDAPGADLMEKGLLGLPPFRELPVQVAGWCGAGPEQEVIMGEDVVYVPEAFARGRDLLAFEVHGDSMEAYPHPIYHLDTVIVDRRDKGFDGAAVVARLEDGYVCKLLKDDKFGRNLYSRNTNYTNGTPPAIPAERVLEIVGRVVKIISTTPTSDDPSSLRKAA